MADAPPPDSLSVGYGRARVSVTGSLTIVVLLMVIQIGAIVWGVVEARRLAADSLTIMSAQHLSLTRNDRVLACVLSIAPAERDRLRQQPSIAWDLWCPGIMADDGTH